MHSLVLMVVVLGPYPLMLQCSIVVRAVVSWCLVIVSGRLPSSFGMQAEAAGWLNLSIRRCSGSLLPCRARAKASKALQPSS